MGTHVHLCAELFKGLCRGVAVDVGIRVPAGAVQHAGSALPASCPPLPRWAHAHIRGVCVVLLVYIPAAPADLKCLSGVSVLPSPSFCKRSVRCVLCGVFLWGVGWGGWKVSRLRFLKGGGSQHCIWAVMHWGDRVVNLAKRLHRTVFVCGSGAGCLCTLLWLSLVSVGWLLVAGGGVAVAVAPHFVAPVLGCVPKCWCGKVVVVVVLVVKLVVPVVLSDSPSTGVGGGWCGGGVCKEQWQMRATAVNPE
jgi:hypothetical protein